ncbi:hypothetical protein K9M79_07310 [Candidatus Woesearchaeota archaeon]|nr:hypothetical protein [Candidatus Woesearchaeota archaeon]
MKRTITIGLLITLLIISVVHADLIYTDGNFVVYDGNIIERDSPNGIISTKAHGGANDQNATVDFYSTFDNHVDKGVRRTASITAGFDGGVWGTEYLSIGVGESTDNRYLPTERVRITSSGDVGVGTGTPEGKLHVYNTADSNNVLVTSGGLTEDPLQASTDVLLGLKGSNAYIYMNTSANTPYALGADVNGFSIYDYDDASTHFVIADGGNVGFGTTSPSEKLTIESPNSQDLNVSLVNGDESYKTTLFLGTPHQGNRNNGLKTAIIAEGINSWSRAKLHFALDNTAANSKEYDANIADSKMTIQADGNVGIGDTTPQEKLDVAGSVRADSFIEYSEDFTGDAIKIIKESKTRDSDNAWKPVDHESLTEEMIVTYNYPISCDELNLTEHAECKDTKNGSIVYGRILNKEVAINKRAIQQLIEINGQLMQRIESLESELLILRKNEISYGYD